MLTLTDPTAGKWRLDAVSTVTEGGRAEGRGHTHARVKGLQDLHKIQLQALGK